MKRLIVLSRLRHSPLVALIVSIAVAQTGAGYDLTWSTIDGGDSSSGAATRSMARSASLRRAR